MESHSEHEVAHIRDPVDWPQTSNPSAKLEREANVLQQTTAAPAAVVVVVEGVDVGVGVRVR